jgi:TolA-binding protein
MTIGNRTSRTAKIGVIAAALLIAPRMARPAAAQGSAGAPSESWQDQSAQDRAQADRDREQERRDREQERKDREQERIERQGELYDEGREALDEDRYDEAATKFTALADMSGPQTDAALYWKAYAENKRGKRDSALTTIADLKKRFPQSRWIKDSAALEI